MPKTSKVTTARRGATVVKDAEGFTYLLSKNFLRESTYLIDGLSQKSNNPYVVNLVDLKQSLNSGSGNVLLYLREDDRTLTMLSEYPIYLEKKSNGHVSRLRIGCRIFDGNDAKKIVFSARAAKPSAKAATV